MKTLNKSLVVEAALAALFAAAFVMPSVAQDSAAPAGGDQPAPVKKAPSKKAAGKVHCFGINSCKGKSECKGQGWISVSSAKKCTAKKGTVVGAKPAAAPAAPAAPATPAQ